MSGEKFLGQVQWLRGMRVLDFSSVLAGPYATRLMADFGADVIKVESPAGDLTRSSKPLRNGVSAYFGYLNCGKRSIVLDLKSSSGRSAAEKLVAVSDVVVENWRPGVAAKLGLDYPAASKIKSDVIYCSISGFGQSGPASRLPAYAPIIQALSGFELANAAYQNGASTPAVCGIFVADVMAGLAAFASVQMALARRRATGEGSWIDVSLLDAMFNLLVFETQDVQFPGSRRPISPPLPALDGYVIVMPLSQENFERLAAVIGRSELIDDDRFRRMAERQENWSTLMGIVAEWTRTRSAADCDRQFAAAGVPCGRYRTVAEAMADEHSVARRTFREVRDAEGAYRVPVGPFRFAAEGEADAHMPEVPELGQHTEEVLKEIIDAPHQ